MALPSVARSGASPRLTPSLRTSLHKIVALSLGLGPRVSCGKRFGFEVGVRFETSLGARPSCRPAGTSRSASRDHRVLPSVPEVEASLVELKVCSLPRRACVVRVVVLRNARCAPHPPILRVRREKKLCSPVGTHTHTTVPDFTRCARVKRRRHGAKRKIEARAPPPQFSVLFTPSDAPAPQTCALRSQRLLLTHTHACALIAR